LTTKPQVEPGASGSVPPALDLSKDFTGRVKFTAPTDEDMVVLAALRSGSGPWKERGEQPAESMDALTKLRPYISIGKVDNVPVGYVTVERDGPVPGASYMRNIVVKHELRKKGLGKQLLDRALTVARDMNRKTLALRVDPANSSAVSFYRSNGFTTVATVVSKKSGKLRLLMSREL
jgi:[ribosomal protein S18]-alanine N-acetyltransferase